MGLARISIMLKIIPFNLLLIFLVVVVTGKGTHAIFNQNVLAQNSGDDSSRGLNFDSLFGSSKEGFSFDELFPFGDSSTSSSQDESSSSDDDSASSSQDKSAATDPWVGSILYFPSMIFNLQMHNLIYHLKMQAPQVQTTIVNL